MRSWVTGRPTGIATLTVVMTLAALLAACAEQSVPPTFQVSVVVEGLGSVVSEPAGIDCPDDCAETLEAGAVLALTALPDAGQTFVGWSGSCSGQQTTCELVVDGPESVTAVFEKAAIVVDDAGGGAGGATCTLRDAISAANLDEAVGGCPAGLEADVIRLPAGATIELTGVDNEDAGPAGLPAITSEIVIDGAGATVARVSSDDFRFFSVLEGGNLHLRDLTLTGGELSEHDGGAVLVSGGVLTAEGTRFVGNSVTSGRRGGAVHNDGGTVTLERVLMEGNSARGEGAKGLGAGSAVSNARGFLRVVDSDLSRNGTFLSGEKGVIAAVGLDAYTIVDATVITANDALGVFNQGEIHLTGVEVSFSSNALLGGIVNEGVAFLDGVTVSSNSAELVSGVSNTGFLRLRESTVAHHRTVLGFSGVRNDGIMEVIDSAIEDNDSREGSQVGGGVTNSGRLTLVRSEVTENRSVAGGGIHNTGQLVLIGSVVDGNLAELGGGIYSSGSVDLLASSIVGGTAGNSASRSGGGVYVADDLDGERLTLAGASAVRGNIALGDGGGIFADAEFSLELCETCAIEQNVAETGVGGGIHAPGVGFGSVYSPGIRGNSPDAVAPGSLLVLRVSASEDDAEELRTQADSLPAGTILITDAVLDMPVDAASGAEQYIGVRFAGVDVPIAGAVVDARIKFTAAASNEGETAVIVGLENSIPAAPFLPEPAFDLSSRARIGSTYWDLAPWTEGESGPRQASPSLRNQVQQLIDRPEWVAGSPLAFVLESAGGEGADATRAAHSFDGDPSSAPELWLLYFPPVE